MDESTILRASRRPRDPGRVGSSGPAAAGTSPADRRVEAAPDEVLRRLAGHAPQPGRYEVRGEIARGGMGVVLRVWDDDLRRHLAMKVTLGASAVESQGSVDSGEPGLARFLEEAQITGQLQHPAIVPVHDLGLDPDGRPFFTMPLVRGFDFREVIRRVRAGDGEWGLPRSVGVLLKVCEAVAYAHSRGVIHRDLKPTNVMVGAFGQVYVMDWGLARVLGEPDARDLRLRGEDLELASRISTDRADLRDNSPQSPIETLDGTVVGTPSYMPPEQAQGRLEQVGPRSDVYALGAMLYHLLTGFMPYLDNVERASPHTILAALLQGPPRAVRELAPRTPADLAAVCEKAMAPGPAARYASASELARDLQAWLERRPVAALPVRPLHLVRLAAERNRLAATVSAAAALVLLVAAVTFVVRLQGALRDTSSALALVETERDRVAHTSGLLAARSLLDEEGELGPLPEQAHRLETWLERADALMARADGYRAELAVLPESHPERAELESTMARLGELAGLLPRVRSWHTQAAALSEHTVEGPAARAAWAQAREAIAASPRYGGLPIEPQLGLLPLGENPSTGLWEFWHVTSGERPRRALAEGHWDLRPQDGVVLVLVPGGEALLGSPEPGEQPPQRSVSLEPYLLAAFEVTQAQYVRLCGENPSTYRPGIVLPERHRLEETRQEFTPLNPVENISWHDADTFARRMGLVLPSEDQWELACRAGSADPWWPGPAAEDLAETENVADQCGWFVCGAGWGEWRDGFALHAPVGSLEPNPFGLFDMHGNVTEWTATAAPADWADTQSGPRRRVFRGGSFYLPPPYARSWFRQVDVPRSANPNHGFRVARALTVAAGPD